MRYIKRYNEGILDIFKKKKEQEMEVYKDPEKLYYSYDVFDSSDKKLSERDVREFFQRVIPKDDDSFEF